MRRYKWLFLGAAVLLSAAICALPSDAQMLGMRLSVGEQAPDFTLADLEGKEYQLYALLKEHVICLDFWATWCNDCRKELPDLEKIYQSHRDKGFLIIGMTLDQNIPRIREIAGGAGLTYPLLLDTDTKVATELYKLTGIIPLKVVIDREGIIQYVKVGRDRSDPPELDEIVAELVE